jgi:hypothetical protein
MNFFFTEMMPNEGYSLRNKFLPNTDFCVQSEWITAYSVYTFTYFCVYEYVLLHCIIAKLLNRYSKFHVITSDVTGVEEAKSW